MREGGWAGWKRADVDWVRQDPDHILPGDLEPGLDTVVAGLAHRVIERAAVSFAHHFAAPDELPVCGERGLRMQSQAFFACHAAAHFPAARSRQGREVETAG